MTKQTLLQKAQALNTGAKHTEPTAEEKELALSWLKGEVRAKAVAHALGYKSPGNVYTFVARTAQSMVIAGELK